MKKLKARLKDSRKKTGSPTTALGRVFDKHIKFEFKDKDVGSTMKTMVKEPYVHHVPVLTGGVGYDNVYNFYKNDFVGKMPDDTNLYAFRVQLVKIRLLMNLF